MPQDAFHIHRAVAELNAALVHGKINRISQVNKDELTFVIYTGKKTEKLIISTSASGARVCISQTEKEPAPVAPNFCMLLRKHLQGAEILRIRQHEFERIVEIDLHCTTDFSESDRTLHCELMGKYSNVVLTEKGIILGALKTTSLEDNAHRVLLTGAKYLYPAPQEKLFFHDEEGLCECLKSFLFNRKEGVDSESLSLWLFENVAGIALPTAREIVRRAEKEAGSLLFSLSPSVELPLWKFIKTFCLEEPVRPCVKIENGVPTDFFAFPIEGGRPFPSLCAAEDEYFTRREGKKAFDDKRRKLENLLRAHKKKQAKRIQECLDRLKDAEKAEDFRVKGELLTANLYRVEKGATGIELDNWYSETGEKIRVALDPTLSPSQNAQRLFKTYNKHKRAKEILTPMLKKEEDELSYTDSILASIFSAESEEDLKEIQTELTSLGLLRTPKTRAGGKKKEEEVPFRCFSYMGYDIFVGRNNLQNDRLLRFASENDVWLHTQKYHSAHVIVSVRGGQVRDEVLLYAAELCAYYSDGREGDKIPVDYCKRKFVKKPNKSKAGFVIYTDYKTLLVTPNAHK